MKTLDSNQTKKVAGAGQEEFSGEPIIIFEFPILWIIEQEEVQTYISNS